MATQQDGIDITMPAARDLSAYKYRFVKADANGAADFCGANDAILGILQNSPRAADREALVRVAGNSKLVFGAAANEGSWLCSGVQGCGTVAASVGDNVGAYVITAVGGSGDIMSVDIQKFRRPA